MSSELTVKKEGSSLAAVLEQKDLSDMVKPLIREIPLFDAYVSGTNYTDRKVIDTLTVGQKLKLQREESRYDDNAIMMLTEDGTKVGYVPRKDNAVFARLMDAGKCLTARVKNLDLEGSFAQITVEICLIDF